MLARTVLKVNTAVMAAKALLDRRSALTLLSSIAVLGLASFQYGDKYNLNSMPFAEVSRLSSDLAKAQKLAKEGNIELLAGQAVRGTSVYLRGELTDANCLLTSREHAYDHAFCARLCVAAGSPLIFISDDGGKLYLLLTKQNAVKFPILFWTRLAFPGSWSEGK
jgi:hypothetical protein